MSGSRESNIEILRIISIIAITLYHNSIWGGYYFDDVTINKILIESLSMFGKIGSNLFILITGYFSIKKFSVKKIIQIEMQTVFFSWTLLIISLFWIDINIKDIVKNILPTVFGNYWFPTAFIIWGLFIPYINKLCILLKKRELGSMIFFCICVWFVVPCITFNQEGFGLNNYMCFPIMYIMGVYLRLFPIQCGIKWGGSCFIDHDTSGISYHSQHDRGKAHTLFNIFKKWKFRYRIDAHIGFICLFFTSKRIT